MQSSRWPPVDAQLTPRRERGEAENAEVGGGVVPHIALQMLGSFRLTVDEEEVTRFRSHKIPLLLSWLVLEGEGMHPRSTVAGLFWPEHSPEQALQNLRQTLVHLKRSLAEESTPGCLQVSARAIAIQHDEALRVDALEFLNRIEACQRHRHPNGRISPSCAASLEAAVARYRGPFLLECDPGDNEELYAWIGSRRTLFQNHLNTALQQLTQHYLYLGRAEDAERHARRWIELDPFSERAIADLVQALEVAGRSAQARTELAHWHSHYVAELGEEPNTATLSPATKAGLSAGATLTRAIRPEPALTRLPAYLTPFFGRVDELRWCAERLLEPTSRLLTLMGPGGCGKTRLALEFARLYGPDLEEPPVFVPLYGLSTADAIPAAIAEHLDWRLGSLADPVEMLVKRLGHRSRLVILDGIDPLLPQGAEPLSRLLRSAPHLVLIVTSRERLRLQGELVLRLDGLANPASRHPPEGEHAPAVALFLERASRLRPALPRDEASMQAITRLCQRLEGMPLSLELAAGLVETFTPMEIVGLLERRLDKLETRWQDVPVSHRSLRLVFEQSFQRLTPQYRTLLAALSTFPGTFDAQAATVIAGAGAEDLEALRDRSLLRLTEPGRYQVFEAIRRFARDRHDSSRMATAAAHGKHYAEVARHCLERLRTGDARDACTALAHEWPNLRAALVWGIQQRQLSILEPLLDALSAHPGQQGNPVEGIATLLEVRGALLGLGDAPVVRGLRAQLARNLALFRLHQGDARSARPELELALQHFRELGLRERVADALTLLGELTLRWDPLESARRLQESIEVHRDRNVPGVARAELSLATATAATGDYPHAFRLFRSGLDALARQGSERQQVLALTAYARARLAHGDADQAVALARQALEGASRLGERPAMAGAAAVLADGLLEEGRLREARRQVLLAHALGLELAHADLLCDTHRLQGLLALERGELEAADRHLTDSLRVASRAANPGAGARTLLVLARLLMARGELEDARAALRWIQALPAAWRATRKDATTLLHECGTPAPLGTPATLESPAPLPLETLLEDFDAVLAGLGIHGKHGSVHDLITVADVPSERPMRKRNLTLIVAGA